MTHPTTDLLYDAIGQGITDEDDGTLLAWLDGPTSLLGEVDDVVRDTDELPGWAAELTSELTHRPHWTAQFLGVQIPAGADDATARALIRDRPAFRRGTVPALIAAAQATLTGTRYVNVIERDGSAYALRVQTFTEETPDAAGTLAALLTQKPAGLVLTYSAVPMSSYSGLEATATQTYTSLEAEASQTYTTLEA
jgi:hypothetical protein